MVNFATWLAHLPTLRFWHSNSSSRPRAHNVALLSARPPPLTPIPPAHNARWPPCSHRHSVLMRAAGTRALAIDYYIFFIKVWPSAQHHCRFLFLRQLPPSGARVHTQRHAPRRVTTPTLISHCVTLFFTRLLYRSALGGGGNKGKHKNKNLRRSRNSKPLRKNTLPSAGQKM